MIKAVELYTDLSECKYNQDKQFRTKKHLNKQQHCLCGISGHNRHIWMPGWSVHWVLIWLNLSTSSPVCLPLCLQLSGFTAQAPDWLTPARLACVFMHAGPIISPSVHLPPSFQFHPLPRVSLPSSFSQSSCHLCSCLVVTYFQVRRDDGAGRHFWDKKQLIFLSPLNTLIGILIHACTQTTHVPVLVIIRE